MKKIGLVLSVMALVSFASLFGYNEYTRSQEKPPEVEKVVAEDIEPPSEELFVVRIVTGSWFTSRSYETQELREVTSGLGLPVLHFVDKNTGHVHNIYMHNNSITLEKVK